MQLVQISAWNDSGGGFIHRLLDGHPGLRAWPFELLLGLDGVDVDCFGNDWFRGRFRWPRFDPAVLAARDGASLFDLVSDTELKGVLHNRMGAKHRDFPIAVDLATWRQEASRRWSEDKRFTQGSFIESYAEALMSLLNGQSDDGRPLLAHCPCAILDAPETWADLPQTRFICVIRSPLSGFADMNYRHPGLDPRLYAAKWSLVNSASVLWAGKAPHRVQIVTLSDVLEHREATLRLLCDWLGLQFDPIVLVPTWRGRSLLEADMGPFGGVPTISVEREVILEQSLLPETRDALLKGTESVSSLMEIAGYSGTAKIFHPNFRSTLS